MSSNFIDFEKHIEIALRSAIYEVADKIIEEAKNKLEIKIKAELDHLALSLFSHYRCERNGSELIIRVEKKL